MQASTADITLMSLLPLGATWISNKQQMRFTTHSRSWLIHSLTNNNHQLHHILK